MRIFHYNDEESDLHRYLAAHGHTNVVLAGEVDPFPVVRRERFDAAFVGLHPHGLLLIAELQKNNPECPVTIITADRNTRMAVEAMKAGAFDYLLSPLDFAEVERTYILMTRDRNVQDERRKLQDQLAAVTAGTKLVGTSEPIQNLRRLIAKAARTRAPALISGETGTGKELIARLLHEQGDRAAAPFVAVNCNAIPATLLEGELFGFKKGSFTGADADRPGLLVDADGGTFFLDELHDLDLPLQGKLLRVLQDGEVRPVGGRTNRKLNVRFVAATNQELPLMIRERKFREDLFYRLNVVPIRVPPLRERMEDLALLVRYFIDLYSRREGREPLKVAPGVWRWMNSHSWPGNIRELENLCQRAVALTDGDTLDTDALSLTASFSGTNNTHAPTAGAAPHPDTPFAEHGTWRQAHFHVDQQIMESTLARCSGNVSKAAHILGMSRTTFYAKARRINLVLPRQMMANPS